MLPARGGCSRVRKLRARPAGQARTQLSAARESSAPGLCGSIGGGHDAFPGALVAHRHESEGLVDGEHVSVLFSVEGRDRRMPGVFLREIFQIGCLQEHAETVPAVLPQHEGVLLAD